MSKHLTQQIVLAISVVAAADLPANRFVKVGGALCQPADTALGITEMSASNGKLATVNAMGLLIVEAGDAVTEGSAVESDTSGRAVTLASATSQGIAITGASAAGEKILILRGA